MQQHRSSYALCLLASGVDIMPFLHAQLCCSIMLLLCSAVQCAGQLHAHTLPACAAAVLCHLPPVLAAAAAPRPVSPFPAISFLPTIASQWQTNIRRRCSFRPDPQLAVVQWAAGHGTCAPASSLFASTTLAGDVIVSSSLSRYGCDGCMPSST